VDDELERGGDDRENWESDASILTGVFRAIEFEASCALRERSRSLAAASWALRVSTSDTSSTG